MNAPADKDNQDTVEDQTVPPEGYAQAVEELEIILEELDDEAIDIDVLGAKVARAAELIQFCRGRIRTAELQVNDIVADLEDPGSDTADANVEAPDSIE